MSHRLFLKIVCFSCFGEGRYDSTYLHQKILFCHGKNFHESEYNAGRLCYGDLVLIFIHCLSYFVHRTMPSTPSCSSVTPQITFASPFHGFLFGILKYLILKPWVISCVYGWSCFGCLIAFDAINATI